MDQGQGTVVMDFYELADQMADRYGLDPSIFRRQIQQESGFQEDAVSPVGAVGLGQVMPATAAKPGYGVEPLASDLLTDPEENLRFSAEYMRAMLDKFDGDYSLALAAYNAGAGAVDEAGGVPDFKETKDYVSKILGSGSSDPAPSSDLPDRPETVGGVEAALKTLIESDGEDARGDYKNVMRGLASLSKAFDAPEVRSVKPSAQVSRGRAREGNALGRFEGLASLGGL